MTKPHFWSSIETVADVDAETPASVKSAARAFRVIEFFDEIRRAARANEIADRLGFPQSSTSVLLNSMVRLGYLDHDTAKHTYMPTLRVAVLASWLDTGHFRDGSVMGMLEKLAGETGYAVSLSTRSGIFVRYLHAIQAQQADHVHITLAARRYAVWSSAGIILLANAPEADVKTLVRRTRAEEDPVVRHIEQALVFEHLAAAREKGYFFSRGLVTARAGAISIKLPVSIAGTWQAIALSVAGDLSDIEAAETDIVQRMRDAIRSIAR